MPEPDIEANIKAALAGLPADFDGFDRVFAERLRPQLSAMELGRQAAAAKAKKGYLYGAAMALIGAALVFLITKEPVLMIAPVVIGGIVAVLMGGELRTIGKQAKSMMVKPIAAEFDLQYFEDTGAPNSIYEFHKMKLVPNWDRDSYEDLLSGERNGVQFEFFEAHLEEKRVTRDSNGRTRTRWVTVFAGQCLRFKFYKTFHGRTLVARDAGLFNRFGGGSGMKIAKLEDPVFEKAFSVYTTDQVESRYLLTPDLMQRLVDLEEVFRGGRLRCAFVGGEVLIALEGGDLFEPGSMFTPLDNPERVRELLDDFAAVFHLIDAMSEAKSA